MSLLWVKAGWADASPEARERRVKRVKHWIDSRDNAYREINIPDHFGNFVSPQKVHDKIHSGTSWFEHGHLLGNVHSHHLPWHEIPLDKHFHITQGVVLPEHLHHKIDAEHQSDWSDEPTEGMWDEHDPTPDPIVFKHKGEHYLLDGHHRFVQHRLLGIPTMHARVYDADDPKAGPENCWDCQEHTQYCSDCGGGEGDDED